MPIYNFKGKGRSGYSGSNPAIYGDEVLPSFTDVNWAIDGDAAINGSVATYTNNGSTYADITLSSDYFLSALTPGTVYEFQWTLANINYTGDLRAELDDANYSTLSTLSIVNGTSSVRFTMSAANTMERGWIEYQPIP